MKLLLLLLSSLCVVPAQAQRRAVMEGLAASSNAIYISTVSGSVYVRTAGTMTVAGNAFSVGGSTLVISNGNITVGASGTAFSVISTVTYTPTATNGTNIAGSTPLVSRCQRVGNIVNCSGRINIDVTAAGAFDLEITIPFASDFSAETDCLGTAISNEQTVDIAGIRASIANDRAIILGNAASTANTSYSWMFQYVIQ